MRKADGLSIDLIGAMLSDDLQTLAQAAQAAREMLAEKLLKNEVADGAEFEAVRGGGVSTAKMPLKSVMRLE
ncbi:hypothetical protein [Agrobacterium sp. DE0009]|uniref:hypothetical protein n=1 Tax=Agrobacterium sp. DE0009 TaxID=2587505 RepID=UPI00352A9E55